VDKESLFALYFSGVLGWQLHPGYSREGVKRLTVDECAELAEKMVEITKEKYGASGIASCEN